jgi:hypothetical protein
MSDSADEVVDAMLDLVTALRENSERNDAMVQRANRIIDARRSGKAWRDIIVAEDRPLIVELIGQNLDAIYTSGGRLRRAQAKALHDEGLSMEQVARLFGVTRQRVSALLRDERDTAANNGY